VEKLGEQVEKGLDGTLMKNMTQAMLKGGVMGFEAYQSLLTNMFRMGKVRPDDAADIAARQQRSTPTDQAAAGSDSGTGGANTGGGTR